LGENGLIFLQNCWKYSQNEPELEKRVNFTLCFQIGIMDIKEIQDLIKFVAKSGVSEVELETKGVKIVIKTQRQQEYIAAPIQQVVAAAPLAAPAPSTAPVAAPAAPAPVAAPSNSEAHYVTIKSPMIGTFYRRPSPDKPIFANVGDDIKPGKVLCIIEAMKLFNEIEAEISGKIVKILVDDASPVEYDQPLFLVDPS
jgi:acetyl-CoA carboxylase biotin carboxyl carrier protein